MSSEHYQCTGIGCGPSNLSVAALLHNHPRIRNIVFDMKPSFSWHEGMMLPGTSLQVSMFKDMVTLADPMNRFSYVSYLHQHGRLLPFLNARFEQVPRLEFADYLKWVANTNENIHFGERVESVDFDGKHFVIETSKRRVQSENVVVGVGTTPFVPEFARTRLDGETHFHIHEFAKGARRFGGRRVLVVGGGQSGAEAVLELLRRTGDDAPSEVSWLSRRENFHPIDDSPFANELFTPTHSNYFYEQGTAFRADFLKRNVLASDGISEHTLRDIYQRMYVMRYIERSPMRVRLMPYRDANEVWRAEDAWMLSARHMGSNAQEILAADMIVWATGFRSAEQSFLQPLNTRLEREDGEIRIDRDYAAVWDGPSNRQIFMLNSVRRQRGLADPNLSLTAWRSQIVIDRMLGQPRRAEPGDDLFVNWAALESI
ncbi:SidA/IucD/PvdA family monooxygenase [Pseudomonas batumici]|uniref:lysine N(6)-hydroxylase/L-ornithine N(5)-oxygenase family protein n=1 Tax=Pseudomonas batumici TaxID=226910 RepID=UPI0030CB0EFD